MNVVDSSGWLEYLADAPGADFFASAIEDTKALVVPTIVLVEVAKKILREVGESEALEAVALMHQSRVVALDSTLALAASQLGVAHRLPLADSIVLATARAHGAIVWTQDSDFEGLPDVQYTPKKKP